MTTITEKDTFRSRLEQALQLRMMKPTDLSTKTGISAATISQYRSGYSAPRSNKLQLIAKALRVDPVWLMGMDVPMEKERLTIAEQLSDEDRMILEAYHHASDGIQESVRILLGIKGEVRSSTAISNKKEA
jgi:transcriptional regulator with XRE-family HTH domain